LLAELKTHLKKLKGNEMEKIFIKIGEAQLFADQNYPNPKGYLSFQAFKEVKDYSEKIKQLEQRLKEAEEVINQFMKKTVVYLHCYPGDKELRKYRENALDYFLKHQKSKVNEGEIK
jgi:transcription elongation GreA/GreB family factor